MSPRRPPNQTEASSRQTIDRLLTAAGWSVLYIAQANVHASL